MNDNLYDKLLNHMTYNDQWMNSMTNLMTSYWNAWHHILTIEWLEWQYLWPVTETHDIIWWPLNDLNNNNYDQLLNPITSYIDHWTTWMTILMTSYWIAWHHIMTIEWHDWQSLWQVTESHDKYWPMNDLNDKLNDKLLNRMTSYKDHWLTWMTTFMTSYWITWHILTNEWPQWQT